MFVKPKDGLKIRIPGSKLLLKPEGQAVPDSTFWRRRLADGDVELVKPEASAKPIKEDSSKKEPKGSK